MAAVLGDCPRRFGGVFLKRAGIGDIDFRDDLAGEHLRLLSMDGRGARDPDPRAEQRCQHLFVIRFHGFIPPKTFTWANANGHRNRV